MTMARQILARMAFGIWNGYAPKAGPKALPYDFDFEGDETLTGDLLTENLRGNMEFVQGMYVDNSDNAVAFKITFGITNMRVVVPAFSQGMWPVLAPDQTTFAASLVGGGGGTVHVQFMNVPIAYTQWGPVTVNAAISLTPPVANFTDFSANTTAAESKQVVAANAARKSIIIQNPANNVESFWINFGAAAQQGVNSIEITPGGSYNSLIGPVTGQAITIFSVNSIPYIAKEA